MNLGIGIVGSGAIAKVHASCVEAQSNAHIAGILTRTKDNAKSLVEKFNTEVWHCLLSELIYLLSEHWIVLQHKLHEP